MILYINSFEELKFLKKKKPKIRWALDEDILYWYPCFPFLAHIDKNRMAYSGIEYLKSEEEKRKIMVETNIFFNSNKQLEIE